MNLTGCTKEELIAYIEGNIFIDKRRLKFDILMARARVLEEKRVIASDLAIKSLGEYAELLKPYEGKSIVSIPDTVITKATNAMKEYEKQNKLEKNYQKQWDKMHKEIDINLGREN